MTARQTAARHSVSLASTDEHRVAVVEAYLVEAAAYRARASELVDGIESLVNKVDLLPALPLDVLDRYERVIVRAHTRNLLRLPQYGRLPGDKP